MKDEVVMTQYEAAWEKAEVARLDAERAKMDRAERFTSWVLWLGIIPVFWAVTYLLGEPKRLATAALEIFAGLLAVFLWAWALGRLDPYSGDR